MVEVHNPQRVSPADLAAGGLDVASQQTEQRGFAAPILSNQPHPHSRSDYEIQAFEQSAITDSVGNAIQRDQLFGLPVRRGKVNLGGSGAAAGVQVRQFTHHLVRFIDSRLGLGPAGPGTPAQPFQFRMHAIGEGILPLSLRLEVLFFLL